MNEAEPQSYDNHRRVVFGYHAVTLGILTANLLWSGYKAATQLSIDTAVDLVVAIALLLLAYYARTFATTVQDRIIRLEERLRLERCLPPDLARHVNEFTIGQLIAMRFASEEELPDLARQVRAEGIRDREVIKRLVKAWRPDYLRV